ncbi:MAG: DUF3887 domain-containing protein [Candidatus Humimicrobiaceae bacterium]
MRNKKLLSVLLLVCVVLSFSFLISSTGCAKRGMSEPDYSAAAAEAILLSINKSDYDSISKYFNAEFKDALKKFVDPKTSKVYTTEKDAFINSICKPLIEKIGEYQSGSLIFDRTLSEKGYFSVFYKAKYSKELNGDVSVQFVFKDENGEMLIAGFWFNSKTLAK